MGASLQTHDDTLGVARQAAPELLRQAYRKRAQTCHPDRVPAGAQHSAQQAMAELNDAYAVLSDPARRASYDRWVDARRQRLAAEQAARQAAGQTPAWPWVLLAATIACALLSVATLRPAVTQATAR